MEYDVFSSEIYRIILKRHSGHLSSIPLINQVHHDLDHYVFFFRLALGNHQGQGDEGVVGEAFGAVFAIEDAVVVEEPEEQGGGDAFVSVAEGVVLCDKIQEHGGFLFYAGIELFAAEGLVYLSDAALERVVLLVAEQHGAAKLLAKATNLFHSILVGGVEGFFFCGLLDGQALVVVVVERVEGVGVVRHHFEEGIRFVRGEQRLALHGTPKHSNQLTQLTDLLLSHTLVDGIAFDEVVFCWPIS